uniref:Uncharacterized protein n=1 Tax=Erwinia amylovora ATCC BAA-2158 TaxID=889211 RepID=E5B8N9_ERWAM|nr:hypothetical protein predicted by Glimmer/Critica [Erwinia amylovora ATCC BAA-2158]
MKISDIVNYPANEARFDYSDISWLIVVDSWCFYKKT